MSHTVTSKTFKNISDLKEYMATLSINQIKSSKLNKTVSNNFRIVHK